MTALVHPIASLRRGFWVGLIGLACPLSLACGGDATPARPNVILVSMDTLRADHLGTYGYRRNTSPNIDALAKQSVVFEWAISAASATQPAHRSLYQSRIASHARRKFAALPEIFRDNGYRTAGFTGGGNVSKRFGLARGYERYEESHLGFKATFPMLEAWIAEESTKPFFAFFHSFDIHHPYSVAPPYDAIFFPRYRGGVTGPATLDILSKIRGIFPNKGYKGEVPLTPADKAKIIALYDGGILYADTFIGKLVASLVARGLWQNTILIITSDHGEEFWEHDNVTHSFTVYDEVLRVPLLWHLPGDEHRGMRVARRTRMMDVAPTLLELVGLPVPDSFMGKSLLPFDELDSRPPAGKGEEIVSEMFTLKSLTAPPWKLIKEYPDGKRELATAPLVLYNLESDPGESTNVVDAHPQIARELEHRLESAVERFEEKQVRDVPRVVEDPELRKRLEALGYVIGDPDDPEPPQLPD